MRWRREIQNSGTDRVENSWKQHTTRYKGGKNANHQSRRRQPSPEETWRRRRVTCDQRERRNGHGFQNFSQKDASNTHKKVKGYSAIIPNMMMLDTAANKAVPGGEGIKKLHSKIQPELASSSGSAELETTTEELTETKLGQSYMQQNITSCIRIRRKGRERWIKRLGGRRGWASCGN